MPSGLATMKAAGSSPISGEEMTHLAGWRTSARTKRMAQKPGRSCSFLNKEEVQRGAGKKSEVSGGSVTAGGALSEEENHLLRGRLKARGTGAEADDGQEVGGLNKSKDVGERMAPGPG